MHMMNFDLAHKQLASHAAMSRRRSRPRLARPYRPSVALILMATAAQIIAMAVVLGAVGSFLQ